MVSTSGSQLLPSEAVHNLRKHILPLATVLTPNIPEAKLLLQDANIATPEPRTLDDVVDIAKALHTLGPKYVLIKGGHLPLTKDRTISRHDAEKDVVVDVLYDGNQVTLIESDYIDSKNTHGTGCSLACK